MVNKRTHNTGVVSSIPQCVTFKMPLARKGTGNQLMNSTSLEKTQSPVFGFCYARNGAGNVAVMFHFSSNVKQSHKNIAYNSLQKVNVLLICLFEGTPATLCPVNPRVACHVFPHLCISVNHILL